MRSFMGMVLLLVLLYSWFKPTKPAPRRQTTTTRKGKR